MISKCLLPYIRNEGGFIRKQLGIQYKHASHCEARVWYYSGSWIGMSTHLSPTYINKYTTVKLAMKELDTRLRVAGFALLTKSKAKKLLPLL